MLDELVARISAIEYRLVSDADVDPLRRLARELFGSRLARVGWDAKPDEPGDIRQRRAALTRAVAVIGRDDNAARELRSRLDRVLAGQKDGAGSQPPRRGVPSPAHDAEMPRCSSASSRRSRKNGSCVQAPVPPGADPVRGSRAGEAGHGARFSPTVPLQDFASFVSGLLTNRTARDDFWNTFAKRWSEVEQKASGAPMIFRRVVESLGSLRERAQLDQVRKHLEAHRSKPRSRPRGRRWSGSNRTWRCASARFPRSAPGWPDASSASPVTNADQNARFPSGVARSSGHEHLIPRGCRPGRGAPVPATAFRSANVTRRRFTIPVRQGDLPGVTGQRRRGSPAPGGSRRRSSRARSGSPRRARPPRGCLPGRSRSRRRATDVAVEDQPDHLAPPG